jgi:peptide/nickel transport system substrate-binding protein
MNHTILLTKKIGLALVGLLVLFIITPVFHSWFSTEVKARGGSITEGIIGTPRYLNPVLAQSNADRDLTALTFGSLLYVNPDGSIEYGIAENLVVSNDQRVYTLTINPRARFSDGTPLTAEDVAFTVDKIQSPLIKSPLFSQWVGVETEVTGLHEIQFTLNQPYRDFVYNLTIGVLPEQHWEQVSDEEFSFNRLNIQPIGSGPFYVENIIFESSGSPEQFNLTANPHALEEPFIEQIVIKSYDDNESLRDAFERNTVDMAYGITKDKEVLVENKTSWHEGLLPRNFGIFFNTENNKSFLDAETRRALSYALNRDMIANKVFRGFADTIDNPVGLPSTTEYRPEEAQERLEDAGWQQDDTSSILTKTIDGSEQQLRFTLSVPDVPELIDVAHIVTENFSDIGVRVDTQILTERDLTNEVIRPRDYDAVLFGYVLEKPSDSYAFWHSSQKNDPGLNISVYEDIQADRMLDNIRTEELRGDDVTTFVETWKEDMPALMLYSPRYLYLAPETFDIPESIVHSSGRYQYVQDWHLRTQHIWNLFIPQSLR